MRILFFISVILLSGCIARSSYVDKLAKVVLDNSENIHSDLQSQRSLDTLNEASKLYSEGSSIRLPEGGLGGLEGMLGPFGALALAGVAAYQEKQKRAGRKREQYSIEKARKWARMNPEESAKELEADTIIPT